MKNTIQSYWNTPLEGKFIDNKSDTLCIILPGVAYLLDRSYLDYSKKLACQLNMDVFEMEYGFQISRDKFDIPTQFNILAEESISCIINSISKPYSRYIIIGKSIGTCIQILLNEKLKEITDNITNIYISPIDKTVSMGINNNSLIFTGLSDPLISPESIEKIKKIEACKVITIDEANHSLDIPNDILRTIDVLKDNFKIIYDYLLCNN